MARLRISAVTVEPSGLEAQLSGLTAAGNLDLLRAEKLGLICSSQCPGSLVLRTYDCVRGLRDHGVVLAGGFHSPMERECLGILFRGKQPVVICPARSINGLRLPEEWTAAFDAGRLLLLSTFGSPHKRITKRLAEERNRMIAKISRKMFVPHAAPGSKTLALCQDLPASGKLILTLQDMQNETLLTLGAKPIQSVNWFPPA